VYNKTIKEKMPRTPRYTANEVVKMLEANGWYEVSQKGSHKKLNHDVHSETLVVPMHGGTLKIGTQNRILKQAGLI
jgi:predicted RNA binding protein YcfA (HicA-like mRNA interferase family)